MCRARLWLLLLPRAAARPHHRRFPFGPADPAVPPGPWRCRPGGAEPAEAKAAGDRAVRDFLRETLPAARETTRALAGELIITTLSAVGKAFSERPRTPGEIAAYAEALADMFCAYLGDLAQG